MPHFQRVRRGVVIALGFGLALMISGCGGSAGGGSSGRFVPNDNKVDKINGMSPSEAFHKSSPRRR